MRPSEWFALVQGLKWDCMHRAEPGNPIDLYYRVPAISGRTLNVYGPPSYSVVNWLELLGSRDLATRAKPESHLNDDRDLYRRTARKPSADCR